jgi:hypothetical protein
MGLAPGLHRAVDAFAMWAEDRVARAPDGFRPPPEGPLACFGPLPPAPVPPAGPGPWGFAAPPWGGPPGDAVRMQVGAARGARRGTAILVPPWKLPRLGLLDGWVRTLAGAGREVWLLVPPHHLSRAAPGRRGGEDFVSCDLGRLRAAIEETVREVRLLARAAAPRGPVGVVGLSLGALSAALAATGPEALDFAALVAPPADLTQVFAATAIGRRYARLAERAGAPLPGEEVLRRLLAPLSPGARPLTAGRALVAAGRHDAIVPPEGPAGLARAWGLEPRLFGRGHLTLLFGCRALRREVAALAAG